MKIQDKSLIRILKTDEITNDLWEKICDGYKICFNVDHTPARLKETFSKTITGYTLHAVKMTADGKLMGHNYFQPRPYKYKGKDVVIAVSGGTFVIPEYRKDIFIFKDLFKALCNEAEKRGWIAQIGVPNENSFKYSVKIIKDKYIGDLGYYILPIHAGKALKRNNRILDKLSAVYSNIANKLNLGIVSLFNFKEKDVPLHINENDHFLSLRLSDPSYVHIRKGNYRGTYRMYNEEGILTAYILRFDENGKRSAKALAYIVDTILKQESPDAILYIGTLNIKQAILTKVPKKFVPHALTVTVSLLDKEDKELAEILSSLSNFDYGLLNFDVR
ncbi:MAG: hypothetical protein K2G67_00045 [Muribaculaceae bacterium]|nr:hypothetical protein [Muribaculaceae bacterium]